MTFHSNTMSELDSSDLIESDLRKVTADHNVCFSLKLTLNYNS